jgi:SAM-dependent methyltransferase
MQYDALAAVYDCLVPDALLEPEGAVAAFAPFLDELPPSARILDCAAGTGQLAVGLALRGFDVTATDASGAMVERTRALGRERGASLRAERCTWAELPTGSWGGAFDAVLCVGNSLTHAGDRAGRRAALAAMAGLLRRGGLLAVTSRNWERQDTDGLEVAERLVERGGRSALVIRSWRPNRLDVAVAVLGADGAVSTVREMLAFWPFTHEELDEDLRAAGLTPASSTYAPGADRYGVTARRSAAGAGGGSARPTA